MNIREKQEKLITRFAVLEDEFDRYTLLMQLAAQAPGLPEEEKTEQSRFSGCQSRLWIRMQMKDGKVELWIDSDTLIVKGLGVLLCETLSGHTPQQIREAKIDLFERMELDVALPDERKNGFEALIRYIQVSVLQFVE